MVKCIKCKFVLKSHKDLDVWKRRIAGVTGIFSRQSEPEPLNHPSGAQWR